MCPSIITSGWDDPGGHGRTTDERFNVIASTQAKKFLFSFNCCGIKQHLLVVGGELVSSDEDVEASVPGWPRSSDLVLSTSLDLVDLLELCE